MSKRLLQHKPGEIVELRGVKYKVEDTTLHRHMCCVCALKGKEACELVDCSPAFRDDRTRVYYVKVEGGEE